MLILAIDTSASLLSLALGTSAGDLLVESEAVVQRSHAERLATSCDAVLKEAGCGYGDLSLLALGSGPGSFTGLRIGFGFAKGLAVALRVPIVTFPSFSLYADRPEALAVGDARSGLYFFGNETPKLIAEGELRDALNLEGVREVYSFDALPAFAPLIVKEPRKLAVRLLAKAAASPRPPFRISDLSALTPLYVRSPAAKTIVERTVLT